MKNLTLVCSLLFSLPALASFPELVKGKPDVDKMVWAFILSPSLTQTNENKLGEALCRTGKDASGGRECTNVGLGEGLCRLGGGTSNCHGL